MTTRQYKWLLAATVALIISIVSYSIWQFERTLRYGQTINIELAPVDPRSLMQGDYMALAFSIDRQLPEDAVEYRYAWLTLDEQQRASFHSLSNQLPDTPEYFAVRLRQRDGIYSVGPNAFFFTEGSAEPFEQARWGQFRVDSTGKALLTRLLDEKLVTIEHNQR